MNRDDFFAYLRSNKCSLFGNSLSQWQADGISDILDAFDAVGDGRATTLAYALATAYHETARSMKPVKETVMPWHKDKNPSDTEVIRRLDAWAAKTGHTTNIYWRVDTVTGRAYFGRGFVQLTWKHNYLNSSADAGEDLVRYPEFMLDPFISARVLIRGLMDGRWNAKGKGIAYYLPHDIQNARRTVNVTDKWQDVAKHYEAFLAALQAGGRAKVVKPPALPIDLPDDAGMDQPAGFWASLIELILKLLGMRK